MAAEFEVSSRLDAPADAVWARVTTAEGVNAELMPIVRMTVPRGVEDFDIENTPDGTTLGRSWLLLFGLIPFDWDRIHIERLEPGRAFHERSTMLSQRTWEHSRVRRPGGPRRLHGHRSGPLRAAAAVPRAAARTRVPVGVPPSPSTASARVRREGTALRTVDARGSACPMPLVMTKVAMEDLSAGDELLVLATDPEAAIDLAAWAADEGHAFAERPGEGWLEFVLCKSRRP